MGGAIVVAGSSGGDAAAGPGNGSSSASISETDLQKVLRLLAAQTELLEGLQEELRARSRDVAQMETVLLRQPQTTQTTVAGGSLEHSSFLPLGALPGNLQPIQPVGAYGYP